MKIIRLIKQLFKNKKIEENFFDIAFNEAATDFCIEMGYKLKNKPEQNSPEASAAKMNEADDSIPGRDQYKIAFQKNVEKI